METILLAGGKGTRLGVLSRNMPKPMLSVSGRPFLEYVLDYLKGEGVTRVLLSVGHMSQKISDHFGNLYQGLDIDYAVEETPLGTGGGIHNALQHCVTEDVFVINGDTLFMAPLAQMMDVHKHHCALLTIALREVSDCSRYGKVLIDNDRITAFNEKESSGPGFVNGGVYLLNRKAALALLPEGKSSFEHGFISRYVDSRVMCGLASSAYFIDIGIPTEYKRACAELGRVSSRVEKYHA